MKKKQNSRKVLVGCIIFSIFLHFNMILFLNHKLLWLCSPYNNLLLTKQAFGESVDIGEYEKKTKQHVLNLFLHLKKHTFSQDTKDLVKRDAKNENIELQNSFLVKADSKAVDLQKQSGSHFQSSSLQPQSLIAPKTKKIIKKDKMRKIDPTIMEHLRLFAAQQPREKWEKMEILGRNKVAEKEEIISSEIALFYDKTTACNNLPRKQSFSLSHIDKKLCNHLKEKEINKHGSLKKVSSGINFLPSLPSLSQLNTSSYQDNFDVDVSYCPSDDGEYIFAITLFPKKMIKEKKISQNYYFLIDTSNSIQKQRFTKTRHAIISSLAFLRKKDQFNIYAFDNHLDIAFSKPARLTKESLTASKEFLLNTNIGNFFAATNFSQPFFALFQQRINDDDVNTIIFITNGEELNKQKNYRLLERWTQLNSGTFSLYIICLSSDKNRSLLEFFAKRNKGEVYYATTPSGIKRQLQKLMNSINTPVAKDIIPTIYFSSPETRVILYPPIVQMPNFYKNQPYVILGKTSKLEDFTMFLQGRNEKGWFNLKKDISFKSAQDGGLLLKKQWAMINSFQCYNAYFIDNQPHHLKEAKDMLEPFSLKPLFE